MIRVLSYCRRFEAKEHGPLTVHEMNTILNAIIIEIQNRTFEMEIKSLRKNNQVDKKSKLSTLNPFIDKEGLLRVGGRLQKSPLAYDEIHPIIIPYHSQFSQMLIQNAHASTLHGGNQATLAYIRRKYWIINGKRDVRNILQKCVKCIRYKAQIAEQMMGELPAPRVCPAPPFTHTGVDYAGPIQIRTTKGRGHKSYKGYIAVFVCLTTKAIHLEAVSDIQSWSL
ncbi:uncharacterized protein [Onthophagus taurus]|uniref:uncharacterized protein n=1 Tax=Onthophagus taurus TaxID=166361 RepID=UPI0039BDC37F